MSEGNLKSLLAQRDRDWDALIVEIALAVGDAEDREAAAMGETDEFDPWHALRNAAAATAKLRADLAAVVKARDELADIAQRFVNGHGEPRALPGERSVSKRIAAARAVGKGTEAA